MPKILALLPQQGHHLLKLPMLYSACAVCALTERIILSYLYCCVIYAENGVAWFSRVCQSEDSSNIAAIRLLLRSEIPSGICAKLRTVAASNNRGHMPWSLYYCLFAPHICMALFFTHIPFVVNHTINATPPERLQHCYHFSCSVCDPTFPCFYSLEFRICCFTREKLFLYRFSLTSDRLKSSSASTFAPD